jgi:hypothetical protein
LVHCEVVVVARLLFPVVVDVEVELKTEFNAVILVTLCFGLCLFNALVFPWFGILLFHIFAKLFAI